jgi:uncharacterized membrane protein (UPF0127 family)
MFQMKTFFAYLAVSALLTTGSAYADPHPFATASLSVDAHPIQVEVASNDAQREEGLKFREKMPPDAGMVFVFKTRATHCMWMRNIAIPLAVAFIDDDGRIVNIEDMQAQTLDSHCSKKGLPVRYALEMNAGWFKQKNIKAGALVARLPKPD